MSPTDQRKSVQITKELDSDLIERALKQTKFWQIDSGAEQEERISDRGDKEDPWSLHPAGGEVRVEELTQMTQLKTWYLMEPQGKQTNKSQRQWGGKPPI